MVDASATGVINGHEKGVLDVVVIRNSKGIIMLLLAFCVGFFVALATPAILEKNTAVFTLSGILFFAVPALAFPFIKRNCMAKMKVVYQPSGLELQESDKDKTTVVNWDEIKSYRVSAFGKLSGSGFLLKLNYRNGDSLKRAIIDKDSSDGSSVDNQKNPTLLFKICHLVHSYNTRQTNKENEITLSPGILSSGAGVYLLWMPAILVVIDLVYRLKHPGKLAENFLFFFFTAFLSLGLLARRKQDGAFFKKVLKLHENA